MLLSRRQFTGALAALAGGAPALARAASMPPTGADAAPPPVFTRLELQVAPPRAPARWVRVLVPSTPLAEGERRPGLVLLHGHHGPMAPRSTPGKWEEYGVVSAHERLLAPPLVRSGARDALEDERAAELSAALAQQPFRGAVLICPATPIHYYTARTPYFDRYARWLTEHVLPAVSAAVPALGDRIGLSGVSMGGETALQVLARSAPGRFASFSVVQAAIKARATPGLVRALVHAVPPGGVQVLTSQLDPYLAANRALAAAFEAEGVACALRVPPGQHVRSWMEQVGCLETLHWHDRALHAATAPLVTGSAAHPMRPKAGSAASEVQAAASGAG